MTISDTDLPEAALRVWTEPVEPAWALAVVRECFGIDGCLSPLGGERSGRFRLDATDGVRRVLRVSHPEQDPAVIDFHTQALRHIALVAPGLPVQRLLPATSGAVSLLLPDPQGRNRVIRLLSHLEGMPMAQVACSAAQRRGIASTLARLDRALAGLWHPAGEQTLPWDIQRADRVRPLLAWVPDTALRALAHDALDGFDARARQLLPALRRQPIHNDFDRHKLLVDPATPEWVAGILGFGRMVEAPLASELAVAAAGHLDGQDGQHGGALAAIANFAAAYHAVSPLQDIEMLLLLDMVRARLVMQIAIHAWRAAGPAARPLCDIDLAGARLRACAPYSAAQAHEAIALACARQGQ